MKLRDFYNKKYSAKLNIKAVIKYAAMLIFLLGISSVFYLKLYNQNTDKKYMSTIHSGRSYAILKVGDNKDIHLDRRTNFNFAENGITLECDSSGLKYKKRNKLDSIRAGINTEINTLITPKSCDYSVTLSDGTKVWLNSESSLKYPAQFDDNKRIVQLEGEGYFEVAHNKNKPFIVRTNDVDVRVLGTKFNVNSYPKEEKIITTLVEGHVKVLLSEIDEDIDLLPGMQTIYDRKNQKFKVNNNVNTDLITAWHRGYFMYDKASLEDILEDMSKWYDFEVIYTDKQCRDILFTCEFRRYSEFSQIIEFFNMTDKINIKVSGNVIFVSKK